MQIRPYKLKTIQTVAAPNQLLWSLIGLLLTIAGTFVQASITNVPLSWSEHGVQTIPVGVTYQIGAVLLVGCLGGKNAGALSQIAYLILGSTFLYTFTQGGGISYVKQPQFGYLLGFVPGAWICGYLAFQVPRKLEYLAFSCLCGMLTIHIFGLSYLVLSQLFPWTSTATPLLQLALKYSIYPLPGQLVVVCAVTVLAYGWRLVMFY